MSVYATGFPITTTTVATVNDQYNGHNQSSTLQHHQPRTRYEEDTATIEHALNTGKRLLEAGGSTYLPFTVRTARDIYSQIFQQDDSSGGDDETNFNPGELHQHLGSLDPAAYAEASQASLELLAMGPQLKALDKRFEGELSQVFADILLQHSVSSSFRSKVRLGSVFCHFARLCEMSLPFAG